MNLLHLTPRSFCTNCVGVKTFLGCTEKRNMYSKHTKGYFSLIELLIVVAIISVLASMLMPSLKNALETARRAACLNNEKSYGIGFALFEGDYGHLHNFGSPYSDNSKINSLAGAARGNEWRHLLFYNTLVRCLHPHPITKARLSAVGV